MFEKCSLCNEMCAGVNLKSHLAIERWSSEPSVGENESSSIAAIDNGHVSGYGIGLLYRRIRGRLSCQSAYRAPLINPRKRGLLSSRDTVCAASKPSQTSSLCTFVLPSFSSPFPSFIIYPLFHLSRSSSFFFFCLAHELKIFNLLNVNACSIDRTSPDCFRHWLHIQATRFVQIRNFQYPLLQFRCGLE